MCKMRGHGDRRRLVDGNYGRRRCFVSFQRYWVPEAHFREQQSDAQCPRVPSLFSPRTHCRVHRKGSQAVPGVRRPATECSGPPKRRPGRWVNAAFRLRPFGQGIVSTECPPTVRKLRDLRPPPASAGAAAPPLRKEQDIPNPTPPGIPLNSPFCSNARRRSWLRR